MAANADNPYTVQGWTSSEPSGGTIASSAARLGGRVLDWGVVAVFGLLIAVVGASTGWVGGPELLLLFPLVGTLYEIPMIAVRGQTLGKMVLRVKVVRLDNGLVPGWRKSIGRTIIPMAAALIPLAGWLGALLIYGSLLWSDRRQGWHDQAAKTLVIQA